MMQSAGLITAIVLISMFATESELPGSAGPARRPELTPQPRESLKLGEIPFKIVYETYRPTDGKQNWELYTIKADGSEMTNLTNTPDVDEMYPHVSPDGTKICFVVDQGRGRQRVRHVYYMNVDGTERVHVAAHARQPCWSFDSKSIAYCNDEYDRYSTREYATSGVTLYHLEGSWGRPHRNVELHHLYALCWAPYGKWFLGVVHGGMGFSDTILAFEAFGTGVFDLARYQVKGCRPDLNADGTRMVWGETDWNLCTADINLKGPEPVVTNVREIVRCERKYKVYHVDFSPDGRYIVFSYGPVFGGQQVGGRARGWNLCVGDFDGKWVQITTDGLHNKEPDWMPIPQAKP
ncbi:MAG: PD40 domain-containing protein [Sedimentisphaerales bacterium]|nr:PD40 domain-containing protein [Sedimentisphaerales bacterium]